MKKFNPHMQKEFKPPVEEFKSPVEDKPVVNESPITEPVKPVEKTPYFSMAQMSNVNIPAVKEMVTEKFDEAQGAINEASKLYIEPKIQSAKEYIAPKFEAVQEVVTEKSMAMKGMAKDNLETNAALVKQTYTAITGHSAFRNSMMLMMLLTYFQPLSIFFWTITLPLTILIAALTFQAIVVLTLIVIPCIVSYEAMIALLGEVFKLHALKVYAPKMERVQLAMEQPFSPETLLTHVYDDCAGMATTSLNAGRKLIPTF